MNRSLPLLTCFFRVICFPGERSEDKERKGRKKEGKSLLFSSTTVPRSFHHLMRCHLPHLFLSSSSSSFSFPPPPKDTCSSSSVPPCLALLPPFLSISTHPPFSRYSIFILIFFSDYFFFFPLSFFLSLSLLAFYQFPGIC